MDVYGMVKSSLSRLRQNSPVSRRSQPASHLALALADESWLRALLTDSLPAIAHPHEIGAVSLQIGVPLNLAPQVRIDAVLTFEHIECVLAGSDANAPPVPEPENHSQYQYLTNYHSELVTLAPNITPSQAVQLLLQAGFNPEQTHQILHLPSQAWHKSWWYSLDLDGFLTVPFQRWIRTRRFNDGTLTLQFKDHYSRERPIHFRSQPRQLPVIVHQFALGFYDTLAQINLARRELATAQAILIVTAIPELEMQGYIRQQVSLFIEPCSGGNSLAGNQSVTMVNCGICQQTKCPMQGVDSSPVIACQAFSPLPGL
jgi:hypothetical protein